MLLTPHILAGTLVGGTLGTSPFMSVVLSFFTYFILEFIPHWDPENRTRLIVKIARTLDLLCASLFLFFLAFIAFQQDSTLSITSNGLPVEFNLKHVLAGSTSFIMYVVVYLITELSGKKENLKRFSDFLKKLNYEDRTIWGIIIQIAIPVMSIAILFRLIDFPSLQRIILQLSK